MTEERNPVCGWCGHRIHGEVDPRGEAPMHPSCYGRWWEGELGL